MKNTNLGQTKLKLYISKVPVLLVGVCCSACTMNPKQLVGNKVSSSKISSVKIAVKHAKRKKIASNHRVYDQREAEETDVSDEVNEVSSKFDNLGSKFEFLNDDVDELNSRVTNLAMDINEVAQHRGDASLAANDAQFIVYDAENLQGKIIDLQTQAESENNSTAQKIVAKCSQLEKSVDGAISSAHELNGNLQQAMADPYNRTDEGIAEIPYNLN